MKDNGFSNGGIYATGRSGEVYRGFFVVDVPAGLPVQSAELKVRTWTTSGGPNTINLHQVTTDPSTLWWGGVPIFTDLGDGPVLGSFIASGPNGVATVTLNAAGIAAVNAAQGGKVGFGFNNATVETDPDGFGFFGGASVDNTLILTRGVTPPPAPVPTMSEWAMIGLGLALAGGAALTVSRRRREDLV